MTMAPRSFNPRFGRSRKTTSSKEAITVEVGRIDVVKKFSVHKDLLCQGSTFFRSALHGKWREAADKKVVLPDDHPTVFEIYVHWLYYRCNALKIVGGYTLEDRANQLKRQNLLSDQTFFLEVYVFADKIIDSDFADAIFDVLVASITVVLHAPVSKIVDVLSRVTGGTLEQLLVDLVVFNKDPVECYDIFSAALVKMGRDNTPTWDLMDRIMRKTFTSFGLKAAGSRPLWCGDLCNFHKHGPNNPCYKMKYSA